MAEEGAVGVNPGYSVYLLRQTVRETRACIAKVLLITGGTRNSMGTHGVEGRLMWTRL